MPAAPVPSPAASSYSPWVWHRVLLGTLPGISAGFPPTALKAHARGRGAPGSASSSPKCGLGSHVVPCSSSGSLRLQQASRTSTVPQATRGAARARELCLRAQEREGEHPAPRSIDQRAALPPVWGSEPESRRGLGPEGPAAGGARGPCLGAEPNSIPQQPPARRRLVSNSSPGVTGSRGGARSAPAPPHLSGLTWPLHPPGLVLLGLG